MEMKKTKLIPKNIKFGTNVDINKEIDLISKEIEFILNLKI